MLMIISRVTSCLGFNSFLEEDLKVECAVLERSFNVRVQWS